MNKRCERALMWLDTIIGLVAIAIGLYTLIRK